MRVGKSQLSLKYLELKFRLVCTAKNCVALVFKEMDHCYVVCVVLRCKFSQLRLMLLKKKAAKLPLLVNILKLFNDQLLLTDLAFLIT
jgi:hypothetical protein